MGAATLSHFRAALDENAHLRLACRLHFMSAGRAPRAYDCSAGRRSTAGKNFDAHGERRPAFDRESLSDHGDGVPCPPRNPRTCDSSASHTSMNHIELDGVSKTFGDRVVLARALVSRPSILLMDEPLSSLEDERKRSIASDLLGLHSQFGFTLVYVTHDQAETDLLASRVCRMRDVQSAA